MSNATLESAINMMIEAEGKTLKRRRDVAKKFNEHFVDFAWYDVVNGDQSSDGKAVLVYKKAIYDALKAQNHVNPSQVWKVICAYGREERGVEAPPKPVKPAVEKAAKLIESARKVLQGMESPSESCVDAVLDLQRILAKLGFDVE